MTHKVNLKVGPADYDDIARDMVRINIKDRPCQIGRHEIISLRVGNRRKLVTVRGNNVAGTINVDIDNREDLGVVLDQTFEFELKRARWWEKVVWQWGATDPAVQQSARIAALSFVLGLIGLILGLISVWRSW